MTRNPWYKVFIVAVLLSSPAFAEEQIADFSEASVPVLNNELKEIWRKIRDITSGAGTFDHSALSHLSYASSGHTGFQPAGAYLTGVTADSPLSGAGTSASHLTIDLSSYLTSATAATTYLALDGSNSDDTTDGFDFFKNLSIGAGSDGKGLFIYRNSAYIYTLINSNPTATTYSTVDYQIVSDGTLDLQNYDSGSTGDIRMFRYLTVADGSDGKYLRIRRHTASTDTGGELDLYIDQYGTAHMTTTVVGAWSGDIQIYPGSDHGMVIGAYTAGYLGYKFKVLEYGGTNVSLLESTGANESLQIGGYLTATSSTKHFYLNLDDTTDMIKLDREDTNILGFLVNMPEKVLLNSLGTTLTDGIILENSTTGSAQVAPTLKWSGNSYAGSTNYATSWYASPESNSGILDWVLRCKIPSASVDIAVLWASYLGAVSTYGGVTINVAQLDQDTVIKGDTDANLFYCDTGTDTVGIKCQPSGTYSFEVNGSVQGDDYYSGDGTQGATADVAVAKVGGGTRTLHFKDGLYTSYTDS